MTGVLAGTAAAPRPEIRGGRGSWPLRAAVAFAVLGMAYRLAMLAVDVPPTNSDEATMGLAALHILAGHDFPAFFYGQHYMGTVEAYLAAPILALTGPSVVALRLPNLLLYLAFLAAMWALTRRLYPAWFAAFTVGLLALGSDRILKSQLIAGGGYPEVNPAGAVLVLLAVNLGRGTVRRPLVGYLLWGLVAGLMVWDDWLVLPYLVAAAAILVAMRGSDLRGVAGLLVASAAVVGAAPLIVDYVIGGHNPIGVYRALSDGAGAPWPDRLYGGVLFGIPMGTGMCSPSQCQGWQLWWGVAVPILLVVAGGAAVRGLRRADTPPERARQAGRLALVAAAAVSLLAYAWSGPAGSTPVESARYLSCLLISLPAALWPAGAAASRRRGSVRAAGLAGLVLVLVTALVATAGLVARAPSIGEQATRRADLIAALRHLGVTRMYSDYWTCNTITFATREEVVCAVIGDDLRRGYDRYRPYRQMVADADRPAYTAPTGSALAVAFRDRLAGAGGVSVTAGGYDIYRPTADVGLPRP